MVKRRVMDTALNRLGVAGIVAGIRARRFTAEDVVRDCLGRIADRDAAIGAWAHVDAEGALTRARRQADLSGPLGGVPFGVKDVIDTSASPTEMGSNAYAGHRPRFDAGSVGTAVRAGGIVLGKTVTAEFAGTQPTRTANPHNPGHTPGGSSSGSAAAVADFMVPFAFGTQTGGSVLRPAAFCGIVGFKPTFGFYTTSGVKTAAHSFDTVGLLARSVGDIAIVHAAMMNIANVSDAVAPRRIGVFRSHLWDTVEPDSAAIVEGAVETLSKAGATMVEIGTPPGFEAITEQRAIINAFERARGLAGEWLAAGELFAPQTRDVCERGLAISGERYVAARRAVEAFRSKSGDLLDGAGVDFLLAPAAPGEAPAGKAYAGDPRLQELWTMLHMPSLTLPAGTGGNELPVGVQLIARRFDDEALLANARWVEERLGTPKVA